MPDRLHSLDAFRGFTIAAMILVNTPGSWSNTYAILLHAPWNGWTFADLVFPFFLWIVGVAMTFSFDARRRKGATDADLMKGVLKRSALLFLLGLAYNTFPFGLIPGHVVDWAHVRIPGVLQRIAICYALGSLIYLKTDLRGRLIAILGGFALYTFATYALAVPGVGAGVLEPGKTFAHHLDALLLHGHAYAHTRPWDPEGVLGTVTALGTLLMGALTGDYLRRPTPAPVEKTCWMALTGGLLLFLAACLTPWMPLNKTLWSPSYTLFMGGMALLGFSACFFLVDVKGYRAWARPFITYGSNAILVYLLACALARILSLIPTGVMGPKGPLNLADACYQQVLCAFLRPKDASLAFALANVLLLYGVAWWMDRKRWYLKV